MIYEIAKLYDKLSLQIRAVLKSLFLYNVQPYGIRIHMKYIYEYSVYILLCIGVR